MPPTEKDSPADTKLEITETSRTAEKKDVKIDSYKVLKRLGDLMIAGHFYVNGDNGDNNSVSIDLLDRKGNFIRRIVNFDKDWNIDRVLYFLYPKWTNIAGEGVDMSPYNPNEIIGMAKIKKEFPWLYTALIQAHNVFAKTTSKDFIKRVQLNGNSPLPKDVLCTTSALGGKYLITLPYKPVFCLQVMDNKDQPLPPDLLEFYHYLDLLNRSKTLPKDLEDWLKFRDQEPSALYIDISSQYTGKISSKGLEIYLNGSYSIPIYTQPSINNPKSRFVVAGNETKSVYVIDTSNPSKLHLVNLVGEPDQWVYRPADLPMNVKDELQTVTEMASDPKGNFLLITTPGTTTPSKLLVYSIDTLQKQIEIDGAQAPSFDTTGALSVTIGNQLVFYDANFVEIDAEIKKQRRSGLASKISSNLFKTEAERKSEKMREKEDELHDIVEQLSPSFESAVARARGAHDLAAFDEVEKGLDQVHRELQLQIPDIADDVVEIIRVKLIEPAKVQVATEIAGPKIEMLKAELEKPQSFDTLIYLAQEIKELSQLSSYLDEQSRRDILELTKTVNRKSTEYIQANAGELIDGAKKLITAVNERLNQITSLDEFTDWYENDYPAFKIQIQNLIKQCPVEAVDTIKELNKVNTEIRDKVNKFEQDIRRRSAQVRLKAHEQNDAVMEGLQADIRDFLARMRERQFANRDEAERYFNSSNVLKAIKDGITQLALRDPGKADKLRQDLNVAIFQFYGYIERGGSVSVETTGQQFVRFGERNFPVWEGKVKERVEPSVDVIFVEDKTSRGPGVSRDNIMGDIRVRTTDSYGKSNDKDIYDGLPDDYRLGLVKSGLHFELSPTYVTAGEFRDFRPNWGDWIKGERSLIRRGIKTRKDELKKFLQEHPTPKRKDFGQGDDGDMEFKVAKEQWQDENGAEFNKIFGDYAGYLANKKVDLLRRIEDIRESAATNEINGKGYVPEWQSHWVADGQTEKYLEAMAEWLEAQTENQEGMLILKGHAGTGKDVLVKMFCERTHRPYFVMDCTKWTTEYELSEDITLESENGTMRIKGMPSVVLNAITTPGAVLYFNELNAMPEQAQIFLHSLLDEKRSITLKTDSGRVVKADPSVLIIGSMNPGYPGTFDPQQATRSRTYSIEIEYPPLKDSNDKSGKDAPYNSSEALRLARSVKSLRYLTYETDLKKNEFVKCWDSYVNHAVNNAPEMTVEQKFDMEVIMALVQFADEFRQAFIRTFGGGADTRPSGGDKFRVNQPFTLREMRRCAWALSKIPAEQKKDLLGAEDVAKKLIMWSFIDSHFDNAKEKTDLRNHLMSQMHARKRLVA